MQQRIPPYQLVSTTINALYQITAEGLKGEKDSIHAYYTAGPRNHFFKLETLCRFLQEFEEMKEMKSWYACFKEAEDQLGQYDFHLNILNETQKKESHYPEKVRTILKDALQGAKNQLGKFLDKEGWLQATPPHLLHFSEALKSTAPLPIAFFKNQLGEFIIESIKKIMKGYKNGKYDTNEIESGIHELRRKIRWISMYSQICGGMIQLSENNSGDPVPSSYLSKEILGSSFMIMEKPIVPTTPIYIQKQNFAALSWMINYLGMLKDVGLNSEAISAAFKAAGLQHSVELERALKIINPKHYDQHTISSLAKKESDLFLLEYRILDRISDDIKQSLN